MSLFNVFTFFAWKLFTLPTLTNPIHWSTLGQNITSSRKPSLIPLGGYNRCTTALVFCPFLCVTSFTLVVMFVSPLEVKSHKGRKRRDSVPGCRAAGALLPWAMWWRWMCLAHMCSVNVTEWEDSSTLLTGCSIYIRTHPIYCFSA